MSTERKVNIYVNGVKVLSEQKLLVNGTILAVNQKAAFMLTIASAQSSGDGGVAAIRMARKGWATDIENVQNDQIQCTKVFRNGQIVILRGEQIFTITGQLVR